MTKIGIVFEKDIIDRALIEPFVQSNGNSYVLQNDGLLYDINDTSILEGGTAGQVQPLNASDILVGLLFTRQRKTKVLKMNLLFFRNEEGNERFMGLKLRLPDNANHLGFFKDGGGGKIDTAIHYQNNDNEIQGGEYEFWKDDVDFVVFTKTMMKAIIPCAEKVVFSGIEIDYGIGVKDFTMKNQEARMDKGNEVEYGSKYWSLKAEAVRNSESRGSRFVPNSISGFPCPPDWGAEVTAEVVNRLALNKCEKIEIVGKAFLDFIRRTRKYRSSKAKK